MIDIKEKYENVCKMNKFYKITLSLVLVLVLFGIVSATTVIDSDSITGLLNLESTNITADNITSKQIGGVIYADQYDSIQDAINATDTDGDSIADHELKIPCGEYVIDTALYPFSNSYISGSGECTIIKIANGISVHGFYVYNDADVYISNLYINMSLAGDSITLGGGKPSGIFVGATDSDFVLNNTIKRVRVDGSPEAGFVFLRGISGRVVNCDVSNSVYGVHTDNNKDIIIDNINIQNNTWGIRSTYTPGLLITNSYIKYITNYGISLLGTNKSIISNNVLDGCQHSGIVDEITIEGGTYHEGGSNIITGNLILNSADNAGSIALNTNRTLVSDNYISRSGRFGGICVTGQNNTITGNYLYNIGATGSDGQGIYLDGTVNNIIENNIVIYDSNVDAYPVAGSYGLAVTGICTGNVIENNHFQLSQVAQTGVSNYYNNNTIKNNNGIYPFDHSNKASSPTPFGEGDEYYNTADHIRYCYNGSAWNALW